MLVIGFIYVFMLLLIAVSSSLFNPIIYGAIEDFTKKSTEKLRKFLNYAIVFLVSLMISFSYILSDSYGIYDYISFVSIALIISLYFLKKSEESFLFDLSKIYLCIYSIVKVGAILIDARLLG